jgi:hypothetical protein
MRSPVSSTRRGTGGPSPAATPDWLGAHMSIAGGLPLALERGLKVGCSGVQIKNQRRGVARPPLQLTPGPSAHR